MRIPILNGLALRHGKNRPYLLAASFLCSAAIFAGLFCLAEEPVSKIHKEGEVKIAFGGDVMVPVDVGEAETANFLSGLADTFLSADAAFVNLEGPIGGNPAEAKKCVSINCHFLQQSPWMAQSLARIGVKVVSVANNHTWDMGNSGVASTDAALAKAGIKPAGRVDHNVAVLETGGMRIAFLGFGCFRGIPDLRDLDSALVQIREAKVNYDAVVVSMHAGCEGEKAGIIPKGDERCFGDNRGNTIRFARAAAAAGATIVVGHGPHVPRGWETRKGVPIFYSLGNLATGAGIRVGGKSALAPVLLATFQRQKNGSVKVATFDIVSFKQEKGIGPKLDPDGAAKSEMIALSASLNKSK